MYSYVLREIYVPQFSQLIETYFQCPHIINDQPSGRRHRFECYVVVENIKLWRIVRLFY